MVKEKGEGNSHNSTWSTPKSSSLGCYSARKQAGYYYYLGRTRFRAWSEEITAGFSCHLILTAIYKRATTHSSIDNNINKAEQKRKKTLID